MKPETKTTPKFPAFDKNGNLDAYLEEMIFDHDDDDQVMVDKLELLGYDKETIIRIFAAMECEPDLDRLNFRDVSVSDTIVVSDRTTVRAIIAQIINELKNGMLGVHGQQARYRYIEFLLEDIDDLDCSCNEDQIYSVFIENDYDFKNN